MTALPHCQCARFPGAPCSNAVTQEDLLCNSCRVPRPDPDSGRFLLSPGCMRVYVRDWLQGHVGPIDFTPDVRPFWWLDGGRDVRLGLHGVRAG